MKHAVILARPGQRSLSRAIAEAYADAVVAEGHRVTVRDLCRMRFDPCLKASEIRAQSSADFGADVQRERKLLADVDVFAFVYPFWFNAPPAILKGYVDRVLGMGFGFKPSFGGTNPMLVGRRLISITTSGAPDQWVRDTGALARLREAFDSHLAGVCGLEIVDHIHFGGIVPDLRDDVFDKTMSAVCLAVRRHFPAQATPAV
jgi:NAD(P)H dehydrogenase (quinone)